MGGTGFDSVLIEIFNRRYRFVTLIVVACFLIMVFRLWLLQIVDGPNYRIKSENNRIHLQDNLPLRGMIYDRNMDLLVDDRPSYNLYVIPEETKGREQLLRSLNFLVGLDPSWVKSKLDRISRKSPFKPLLIKKDISREELAIIETNLFNLPGVMIQVNPQRNYIFSSFASHLIGYLGEIGEDQLNSDKYSNNKPGDLIGKYGVERRWQEFLNGLRGGTLLEVDAVGRQLRVISNKPSIPGLNLSLTIDKNLQLIAERCLKDKKGAIVAMDPNNGEILALASSPGFDPNHFIKGIDRDEWEGLASSKDSPLQNRVVSGQYPPGSVFKIIVALAGLEEGVIDPYEEIFCTGSLPFGNHTFHCWKKHGHGKVSFHRALVESCDLYFYKMGNRLGVDKIARYASMCGLGKETGIRVDFERGGLIPTSTWKLKRWGVPWQAGETLSVAIGQSFVLVTPIQMARMISAIFNGGYLYQPQVIRWVGNDEKKVYHGETKLVGQIKAKKENLERIKHALAGVVNEPHGTGSRARVTGINVAGKTGTAQVIRLEAEKAFEHRDGVPLEFRDHAWFVAIAPVEKPGLALAIIIENGGHGGSAAAPLAKEMIRTYFRK
ncbi:MAG: penicillin-binding protein 2 [Pseudomonadota bacterium]